MQGKWTCSQPFLHGKAGPKAADIFRGRQHDCKCLLQLTTKHVYTNFIRAIAWLSPYSEVETKRMPYVAEKAALRWRSFAFSLMLLFTHKNYVLHRLLPTAVIVLHTLRKISAFNGHMR